MPKISRLAPAKVNLYLHVAAPDARGYHPLRSLVVFADIGDEIFLNPSLFTGFSASESIAFANGGNHEVVGGANLKHPSLTIDGPFGDGLSTGEDNLILKAVRRFEAATGVTVNRHDIHLTKNLPVASGIGGGSADAGAVLHLLRDAYAPDMTDDALESVAAQTGADGVMCLWSKASIAEGYGERLTPVEVPPLAAVLINPGVECSTPEVFKAYDAQGHFAPIEADLSGNLIAFLCTTRNDLESPAIALHPVIGEVLRSLKAYDETRFARMSGSGATCFALCDTREDAERLAAKLRQDWPKAWVRPCMLK